MFSDIYLNIYQYYLILSHSCILLYLTVLFMERILNHRSVHIDILFRYIQKW